VAYVLQSLGLPFVWPGNPDLLEPAIHQAMGCLEEMLASGSTWNQELIERWGEQYNDVAKSISCQISELRNRLEM